MKFEFTVKKQVASWVDEVYEVEAESYQDAVQKIEDADYDVDEVGSLVDTKSLADPIPGYCLEQTLITKVFNENGEDIEE